MLRQGTFPSPLDRQSRSIHPTARRVARCCDRGFPSPLDRRPVHSPPRVVARVGDRSSAEVVRAAASARAAVQALLAALDELGELGAARRLGRARDGGLDGVAHLDVGGRELVAGEPAVAEVRAEEREVAAQVRIDEVAVELARRASSRSASRRTAPSRCSALMTSRRRTASATASRVVHEVAVVAVRLRARGRQQPGLAVGLDEVLEDRADSASTASPPTSDPPATCRGRSVASAPCASSVCGIALMAFTTVGASSPRAATGRAAARGCSGDGR